jgi:hypothetical protein
MMPLGSSDRDIHLPVEPEAAFDMVCSAAGEIGKVLDTQPGLKTLTVRTRYGLQIVKLRVGILPDTGGSRVQISGASDDVWGGGARKGTDKLLSVLERMVSETA